MKVKLTILFILFSTIALAQNDSILLAQNDSIVNTQKSVSTFKRWFGISAGWVMKEDIVSNIFITDGSGNLGNLTQKMFGNTVQVGFSFAPSFGKYGLGLYTGLYYEHTWGTKMINCITSPNNASYNDFGLPEESSYTWPYEHALYIPLHFQYKHEFSPDLNLYASAGPSFGIGFSPNKYAYSTMYIGGKFGFQFYGVQISMLTEWGIVLKRLVADYIVARPISVQLSYMF